MTIRELTLNNSTVKALVDTEDFIKVSIYNWTLSEGRAVTTIKGKQIKLHRFICPDLNKIDHKNNNPLDCRKSNLRNATQSDNMFNRGKTAANTSGYKGVTWCKTRLKWKAQITHKYTNVHCGYFSTPEEAALAYNAKARLLCGEFARLNEVKSNETI